MNTMILIDHGKSTLVQEMAWCHQATRHYLKQDWLRFPMQYGIIRPQQVHSLRPKQNDSILNAF